MLAQQGQYVLVRLPAWRRRLLLVLLLLSFVGLLGRSLYLQAMHKDFLQEKGSARYSRKVTLQAQRGKILDRNNEILAISSPVGSIWASPADIEIPIRDKKITDAERASLAAENRVKVQGMLKRVAALLQIPNTKLNKKIANKNREFVYLKRRMSPNLAKQVMSVGTPGIFMQREYKRFYPAGDVAAHVVGFAGIENNGREGFELFEDERLSGQNGIRKVIKNRRGQIVEDLEQVQVPKDGEDIVLSIDRRIQYLAFRELSKAVTQHQAKAGAAVVLDAKTGEILAMVNLPTYNPNNPKNLRGKTRNRTVTDIFEPGSTMKPFSVSAAMEFGDYTPTTRIQTAPGYLQIGPARINDTHQYGVLTVAQVIQKSSNVGSSKMALDIRKQALWNTYTQLGFGAKTGVQYPGEVAGRLRNYKKWRPIEQATMSYGHGISTTLLQLARAYTVFANEGELKPVSLMKLEENPIGDQVFSPETANNMKDMLEMVVQNGGTAPRANIPGYRVAGKTGTAHKLGKNGYEKDKYVGSFVGMAPASNPRLIMAVMIDEPTSGKYYGGTVAAPVFSAVMADALRILSVPQDTKYDNVVIPQNAVEIAEGV